MKIKRNLFALSIILILLLFPTSLLLAIDFPTRPVNIIIGFGQGGSVDVTTRVMTDKISEQLKVPVIILNKPGASGLVGAEFAASLKPDGYNIWTLTGPLLLRQAIDPNMHLDILKNFEPICFYYFATMFVAVKGDSKFKTYEDFVDFALKNPGKISCGSPGIGSHGHFCTEILKASTKISFKDVPFKSDGESLIALMGGHIDAATSNLAVGYGKVVSGDIRPLVTFDETRSSVPLLKDVPTLKEKGYPDAVINAFIAFMAPAGTPKEIIEKLDKALRTAIEDPATVAAISKMGFSINYMGPADLTKFIKSEIVKYKKIAKEQGITLK